MVKNSIGDILETMSPELETCCGVVNIFSESVFRQTYLQNGLFENPGDIGLLIVVDGFQPKYHRNTTMTSIACYVMSLDPNERYYKDHNVISLGIIPGPNKPDNLMSFLESIYEEIKQLGIRGFVVKKGDVTVEEGKVYLMSNTGDIPGIADLMNHDGHMCKHGCRICDIMGEI
ncbi:hypothetical protein G6F56_013102 [Rhizopus delemar]|nr:hypothetical protein G6F56_013102 [Rhizopus delemar]